MLDERVRVVLARLEAEDDPVGRFLFALVAPQSDCGVLEVGAGRGASSIWLAAGVRYFSGRVVSVDAEAAAWRANVAEAGLEEWAELEEGDPADVLSRIGDVFDVVVLPADERLLALALELVEPGALIVTRGAPPTDPKLLSVDVPLDGGLGLSVVLE
jgi:predicted O-methyltransferase YrrM